MRFTDCKVSDSYADRWCFDADGRYQLFVHLSGSWVGDFIGYAVCDDFGNLVRVPA